jgi:hypothetical protein
MSETRGNRAYDVRQRGRRLCADVDLTSVHEAGPGMF